MEYLKMNEKYKIAIMSEDCTNCKFQERGWASYPCLVCLKDRYYRKDGVYPWWSER